MAGSSIKLVEVVRAYGKHLPPGLLFIIRDQIVVGLLGLAVNQRRAPPLDTSAWEKLSEELGALIDG